MTVALTDAEEPGDFESSELKRRARGIRRSANTVCYRALHDELEIAFVAVDRRPELDLLVLYELFVPRALRNQGYGGEALTAVEEMAVKERFSVVRIRQHPLDEDVDHDDLYQ